MNKSSFLEFLSNATERDLNKAILEKGKRPKLIKAIIFYNNEDDKKIMNKQKGNENQKGGNQNG